jgi:hypothetical protein
MNWPLEFKAGAIIREVLECVRLAAAFHLALDSNQSNANLPPTPNPKRWQATALQKSAVT